MPILDALAYDPAQPLLFTSGTFLLLFLVLVAGFALCSALRSKIGKLLYLYLFSLFFYYKSSGLFFGLLVLTTVLDFALARIIEVSQRPVLRRVSLVASLITSLGILGYLKYGNFLIANAEGVSGRELGRLDVILPVGISFYTFQSVSYVVDVYRRRLIAARSLLDYALYLAFFPRSWQAPSCAPNSCSHNWNSCLE